MLHVTYLSGIEFISFPINSKKYLISAFCCPNRMKPEETHVVRPRQPAGVPETPHEVIGMYCDPTMEP